MRAARRCWTESQATASDTVEDRSLEWPRNTPVLECFWCCIFSPPWPPAFVVADQSKRVAPAHARHSRIARLGITIGRTEIRPRDSAFEHRPQGAGMEAGPNVATARARRKRPRSVSADRRFGGGFRRPDQRRIARRSCRMVSPPKTISFERLREPTKGTTCWPDALPTSADRFRA